MNKNEAEILANVYAQVRGLSNRFISALKDVDVNKELQLGEIKFNSPYWIVAHLVWTEHFLIIKGVGGENMNIPWVNEYSFGTDPNMIKTKPPYDEILQKLEATHSKALEVIRELKDEQLDEDNYINATFGGTKSKRNVIIHAIRHEPMHIGQISWILKTYGLKLA